MIKKSKAQRHYETELGGCHVKVVDKDIELALRIMKQKMKYSKKVEELKERKEYVKPSVRRRKEILSAVYSEQFKRN